MTKTRLTEVETALRGKERKAEDLKRDVGRLKSVVEEQQRKLEAALEELGDSKAVGGG